MLKIIMFFIIFSVATLNRSISQETTTLSNKDTLSNQSACHIWLDTGIYGVLGSHSGDFEPIYNLRLGIGKSYTIFQLYGFLELTYYKFDPPDALSSITTSDKRYDIAVYAVGSIFQILYLGCGAYYAHQDNIITRYRDSDIISESGIRSFFDFYSLFGLSYPIKISSSISLPIGLYYNRVQDYRYSGYDHRIYSKYFSNTISLRLGIIYNH